MNYRVGNKPFQGFTIVELLIVVVVIAILAAITIVSYNGIQNRAYDSSVQADLKNLKTKIESWRIDNNDEYPSGGAGLGENLPELGFKASKSAYATIAATENNLWYCRDSTRKLFAVMALSRTGSIYYISEAAGAPVKYTGGTPWSKTTSNCASLVSSSLGWQYAGYASTDTTTGPWRAWAGGN